MTQPAASQTLTLDQALQLALQHHAAGQFQQAESIYRQILAASPNHPDANHFLGVLAHQVGRNDVAHQLVSQSIALKPNVSAYHNNLGQILRALSRPAEAAEEYRRAAALEPKDIDCRNNLTIALRESGQAEEAVITARATVSLDPNRPDTLTQLAASLHAAGEREAAIDAARQAISVYPTYGEAHELLAGFLQQAGDLPAAEAAFRLAAQHMPRSASPLNNVAIVLARQGNAAEAIDAWRRATQLDPNHVDSQVNLARALTEAGQYDESAAIYQRLLAANRQPADAHTGLCHILSRVGRHADAVQHGRLAAQLTPNSATILNTLGVALHAAGQIDEAIDVWKRVVSLDPKLPMPLNNLAASLSTLGAAEEAVPYYRQAIAIDPTLVAAHSNMLLDLHYLDTLTPEALHAEHRAWASQHAAHISPTGYRELGTGNFPTRLRIAYVSPDFRAHSVADFMEPILARHDKDQFEIFCYSLVAHPDIVTQRLQTLVSHWRDVARLTESQIAQQMRDDQIDIAIDLAGHTAHGRPLIFAHKPAPVVATYLGYPDSTGLPTVDFRITDAFADPPGLTESFHTETLIRLPRTAWCYHPYPESPDISPLPADSSDYITFGSFNNVAKVTPRTIALWSRVLAATPNSRLLLKAIGLSSNFAKNRLWELFESHGIDKSRVELLGRVEDFVAHLALYSRVDVALDTFPYHGTTTTCEAFWMGVPVITLAGNTHVSRVGVSLLSNVGLPELIAETPDDYVGCATSLAADLPRLRALRSTFRSRMTNSPLMGSATFTRDLETAYQSMYVDIARNSPRR